MGGGGWDWGGGGGLDGGGSVSSRALMWPGTHWAIEQQVASTAVDLGYILHFESSLGQGATVAMQQPGTSV